VHEATFRLVLKGHVDSPLSLSLDALKKDFEPTSVVAVNQCSGNSRSFFEPRVPGGQWGNGAMGNAKWTGVRLSSVLEMVQPRPEARYVVFVPFANPKQDTGFVRVLWDSIDMADALHPQTLLAYGMNGEALPADHGAPVRLRVARQLGYKNTKYLLRMIVTDDMNLYRKNPGTWYGGI